jgi:hypothetical protein
VIRLAGLLLLAALVPLLGWLKTVYYFKAFGVDPGLVEAGVLDHVRESWFVVQNLAFFFVIWWIALKSRLRWVVAVAVLYSLLPIAAHYAFAANGVWADALIAYRHTLLKLVPFAVLLIVLAAHAEKRAVLRDPAWPYGRPAAALFCIALASWGISSAKHFGSFDAQQAMREPERFLSRARVDPAPEPRGEWFLIAADADRVVLWRRPGAGEGLDPVRVVVVPRSGIRSLELTRRHQVQPGDRYL